MTLYGRTARAPRAVGVLAASIGVLTFLVVPMASALGLVACVAGNTIEAPAGAQAGGADDSAVVESVRAYLHTFKLNERDLTAGLTIPFESWRGSVDVSGTARATGKTGPQGHQIYEVVFSEGPAPNWRTRRLMDIPPE
jgi:hypothetical protein